MHFSEYCKEDKEKLFDLFEKVFKRGLTEEYWHWRNSYPKEPIRILMWDNEKLIAHYALQPTPLKIDNKIENVLLGMSAMVHPDYQRRGIIFPIIANYAYERAIKLNYKLAVAFPNQNSYEFHFGPLSWRGFPRIQEYELKIDQNIFLYKDTEQYRIYEIDEFNDTHDEIWELNKSRYKFLATRTSDYLNWRFFNHPKRPFTNYPTFYYYCFLIEKNGQPKAYFVLKKFGNEKCHLIDYFGDINNEILMTIISHGIAFSRKNFVKYFSFWMDYQNSHTNGNYVCNNLGFVKNHSHSYFGIKIFDESLSPSILDENNWFITMSDSDVY